MADQIVHFKCPDCGLACRLSVNQRAVQHQVPDCKTWKLHKRDGNVQEFLRLALMKAGGAALNLGDVVIDGAPKKQFTEREKSEALDELNEGLKKL